MPRQAWRSALAVHELRAVRRSIDGRTIDPMHAAQDLRQLATTPFSAWVKQEGERVVPRYPLDADQRADDPRAVAYNVESALQAHNVEFAAEPMIEGGMLMVLMVLMAPTADPIALHDSEHRVGTVPEFEIPTEVIEDGPAFTEWHGQFVRADCRWLTHAFIGE